MNQRIQELASQARTIAKATSDCSSPDDFLDFYTELLVKAVVQECIYIVETQQVSVGNSPAGELAAKWTIEALRLCRDDMRELLQEDWP